MKCEAIYAIQTGSREFSVRKMCEAMGLRAENYYRWKRRRKQRREIVPHSPHELKQEFVSHEPGKILVGYITYIRTNIGWVYLAIVMDLYNREVLGYSVSQHIDSELVKRALGMQSPETEGCKVRYFIPTEAPSITMRAIKDAEGKWYQAEHEPSRMPL